VTAPRLPPGFDPDAASERLRLFYRDFFVQPVAALRGEADLSYLEDLEREERHLAVELLALNLSPPSSAMLLGAEILRASELAPRLEALLDEADAPGTRLEIARALARVTGEPEWIRPLLQSMAASGDAKLKERHFDEIRLLPPDEQLELFFQLLRDPDSSFVRRLALAELNALEHRKLYYTRVLPHDAGYYLERRDDRALRTTLIASASSSRIDWEVVF
jgi:hypothetical protein